MPDILLLVLSSFTSLISEDPAFSTLMLAFDDSSIMNFSGSLSSTYLLSVPSSFLYVIMPASIKPFIVASFLQFLTSTFFILCTSDWFPKTNPTCPAMISALFIHPSRTRDDSDSTFGYGNPPINGACPQLTPDGS